MAEVRQHPLDRLAQDRERHELGVEQLGRGEREVAGDDPDLVLADRPARQQLRDRHLGRDRDAGRRRSGPGTSPPARSCASGAHEPRCPRPSARARRRTGAARVEQYCAFSRGPRRRSSARYATRRGRRPRAASGTARSRAVPCRTATVAAPGRRVGRPAPRRRPESTSCSPCSSRRVVRVRSGGHASAGASVCSSVSRPASVARCTGVAPAAGMRPSRRAVEQPADGHLRREARRRVQRSGSETGERLAGQRADDAPELAVARRRAPRCARRRRCSPGSPRAAGPARPAGTRATGGPARRRRPRSRAAPAPRPRGGSGSTPRSANRDRSGSAPASGQTATRRSRAQATRRAPGVEHGRAGRAPRRRRAPRRGANRGTEPA